MYAWFEKKSRCFLLVVGATGGGMGWRQSGKGGQVWNESHFLMISRRAAVLYCVAWGLFSLANLSMLQWPAWLWPPNALYRGTTKAGECCPVARCAPLIAPLYHVPQTPPPTPLHIRRQAGRSTLGPNLTEYDRRQSLINHIYTAGTPNII